jgi:hypothetical protein
MGFVSVVGSLDLINQSLTQNILQSQKLIYKDQLPIPIMCNVQVKSSNKHKKSDRITLFNLHALVRNPLPVFFLSMEFDGQKNPERTYLVHLDQKLAAKILKRVRELTLEGKGDCLNKHEMNIPYPESTRLECNDGLTLKLCIEQHLSMGMSAYQQDKAQWIESLGYEDGYYKMQITYEAHNPISDLVDLAIGCRDEITINGFSGFEKRFGLTAENPDREGESAILKLKLSPQKVEVVVRQKSQYSPGIKFEGNLYTPPIELFGDNPSWMKQHFKLNLEFSAFKFIFGGEADGNKMSYSQDYLTRFPMETLRNQYSGHFLRRGNKE